MEPIENQLGIIIQDEFDSYMKSEGKLVRNNPEDQLKLHTLDSKITPDSVYI